MLADEVVARWHADRRSSAYLNLDFKDDSPALSLEVALSPASHGGGVAPGPAHPGFRGEPQPAAEVNTSPELRWKRPTVA